MSWFLKKTQYDLAISPVPISLVPKSSSHIQVYSDGQLDEP